MTLDELNPCPFCGSEPITHVSKYTSGDRHIICCDKCTLSTTDWHLSLIKAGVQWNTRYIRAGYVLVPVEPTWWMLEQSLQENDFEAGGYGSAQDFNTRIYKAMIKAAQEKDA